MKDLDSIDITMMIVVAGVFALIALGMVLFAEAPSSMEQCAKSCGPGRMLHYSPGVTTCECREKG